MSRRIGVVTVGRSDYGIYRPLLCAIHADPVCELCLIAGGAHLSPVYGNTIREIERDGFEIRARVPMLLSDDSAVSMAMSTGMGIVNFASAFAMVRPDILVVLGDRFEMFAAAISALPMGIPVAHIHGGELTEGAIDDAIRHAISKLSHIHFAATAEYGRRVQQMGEEPWRVSVPGSLIVDSIVSETPLSPVELETSLGVAVKDALLVTYHPVTLELDRTLERVSALLEALTIFDNEVIITYPNADATSAVIIDALRKFASLHPRVHLFENLGTRRYHSLQRYVAAMVGNSSSGMIEAGYFRLPVVNIGERQAGRMRTPNILDVPETSDAIADGIRRAISAEFRRGISTMKSPYGEGDASLKILQVLKTVPIDDALRRKRFCDSPRVVTAGTVAEPSADQGRAS